ncbi:DUF131 domain-containing protein [Candidatus Bathyarchaeota archaeon]|nr:DUF131 domain-containing protein [Candidatus Bathyarchaeota archaeon]NIV44364.1 DUF131 domain-containing protein [Candidatus Bathyarchaeota archaeon]
MSEHLWNIGIVLILAGFLVTFVAIVLSLKTFKGKGKVQGGGAIIIGPFPIIVGTDKESVKILLLLSIVLIGLLLVFMAVSYLIFR